LIVASAGSPPAGESESASSIRRAYAKPIVANSAPILDDPVDRTPPNPRGAAPREPTPGPGDGPPPAAKRPPAIDARATRRDLIAQLDLGQAILHGHWSRRAGSLAASPVGGSAAVEIDCRLARDFHVQFQVTAESASTWLAVELPWRDGIVRLVLDRPSAAAPSQGKATGLEPLDEAPVEHNNTLCPRPSLLAGRTHRIDLYKHQDRVVLAIDSSPVVDWRGAPDRLGQHADDLASPPPLVLTVSGGEATLSRFMADPLVDARKINTLYPPWPQPGAAELAAAEDDLGKHYGPAPPASATAARIWLMRAAGDRLSPGLRFAALGRAAALARQAGEYELALRIVRQLERWYGVDPAAALGDLLRMAWRESGSQASRSPSRSPSRSLVANAILRYLDRRRGDDQISRAIAAAEEFNALARELGDRNLARQCLASIDRLRQIEPRWQRAQAAEKRLAAGSATATDHAALGRYRAFVQGDWPAGLRRLARGDDAAIAELARRDIQLAGSTHVAAADLVDLADQWRKLAARARPVERQHIQWRAAYWHLTARPRARGALGEHVERMLGRFTQQDLVEAALARQLPPLSLREPPLARRLLSRHTPAVDVSEQIAAGLDWIARQQNADGGWSAAVGGSPSGEAATAMALLALLGEGPPAPDRESRRKSLGKSPRETVIRRGLKWLGTTAGPGGAAAPGGSSGSRAPARRRVANAQAAIALSLGYARYGERTWADAARWRLGELNRRLPTAARSTPPVRSLPRLLTQLDSSLMTPSGQVEAAERPPTARELYWLATAWETCRQATGAAPATLRSKLIAWLDRLQYDRGAAYFFEIAADGRLTGRSPEANAWGLAARLALEGQLSPGVRRGGLQIGADSELLATSLVARAELAFQLGGEHWTRFLKLLDRFVVQQRSRLGRRLTGSPSATDESSPLMATAQVVLALQTPYRGPRVETE